MTPSAVPPDAAKIAFDPIRDQFLALEAKDDEIEQLKQRIGYLEAKLSLLDMLYAGGHGCEMIDRLCAHLIKAGWVKP